jgi:peptide/nickel transport system substrate-binding protein
MTTLSGRVWRHVLAAAVLAGGLGLAGCGGSAGSNGSLGITVYDGASGAFTNAFNPFPPTNNNHPMRGMIYQTLLFFNNAKAGDVQKVLATDYKFADGGRSVTFTLRDGVKWSDGEPFSADDVAFTFNLLISDPKLNVQSIPLASAKADDRTHVTLTFTRPAYTDIWFFGGKTYIVPRHRWQGLHTDLMTYTNTKPIGTGPFTLRSFSAQSYVLAKNKNYWDKGKPKIDTIRYVSYSGNQAGLTALLNGQINWSGMFIPDIEKTYAAKNPNNKWINTPQFLTQLTANVAQGPTANLAVRQALYYGMDRGQLNKIAFSGKDTPSTPAELLLPRDRKWLADDLKDVKPTYDAAKAEQVLQQAGYTKGGDGFYRDPNGRKLTITCKVVSGFTDYISALQVMKQQYAKVGIDLEAQELSFAAWSSDRNNGNFELVMDNLYGGPTPYYLYSYFYNSSNTRPIGQSAPYNYSRFSSPVVDQALATLGGTQDEQVQKQAYAQIQHEIVARMPYIPVMQSSTLIEFKSSKVTGWPTQHDLYAIPAPFYEPDLGIVAANLRPAK